MTISGTSTSIHEPLTDGMDAIFMASDVDEARRAFNDLCVKLEGQAGDALDIRELGLDGATAVLRLPKKVAEDFCPTHMLERLNSETRHRKKVVRIFPNECSAFRLIGAFLMEPHEK